MNMFHSRADFCRELWLDYRFPPGGKIRNCFYYKFLKSKKEVKAEYISRSKRLLEAYAAEKKRDKYTLMRSAYLAYKKSGIITEREYKDIFTDLLGAHKSGKKYSELLEENLYDTARKFEHELLLGCVRDFFDNEGFKARGEDNKCENRHRKEKDGYTDIIEMLYKYIYIYKKGKLSTKTEVQPNNITDDYISKCQTLYRAVCRDGMNAFLPLYFDTDSGAGIFIVGEDRFEKNAVDGCQVCILRYSDILGKIYNTQTCDDEEDYGLDAAMSVEICEGVADAFGKFLLGVNTGEYLSMFPEQNLPEKSGEYFFSEDIDDCFRSKLVASDEILVQEKEIELRYGKSEDIAIAILKERGI